MTGLWIVEGKNLDPAYVNLREGPFGAVRQVRSELDAMWTTYEPCADPDFRDGFARDPEGRFWEMYVGCRLLEAGKLLLPAAERNRGGGRPDICVLDGNRRIWIEAIAPEPGESPDRVELPPGTAEGGWFGANLKRQAQLRTTSALWTKRKVFERYLGDGIIAEDDIRLIAIGAVRFGAYVDESPIPLIMSSVFPIGDEFVSINLETGDVVDRGFQPSFEIARKSGAIPRTAFIRETFSNISGVLWSTVSIGNMDSAQRPLTLVHNPRADIPMTKRWGVWDREFVVTEKGDHWMAKDILACEGD